MLRPLQAAASAYRIAFGPRAGQKLLTGQGAMTWETDFKQTLFGGMQGFSLHATERCGVALNDRRWNNSAATSPARCWPTNAHRPTPPDRRC